MKFKIGDKVKLVGSGYTFDGEVGTIYEVDSTCCYVNDLSSPHEGIGWAVRKENLELVEDKPQAKFKVGDKVRVIKCLYDTKEHEGVETVTNEIVEEGYSVKNQGCVASEVELIEEPEREEVKEEKTAIKGLLYWKTINGQRKPIRITEDVKVPITELEENKFGELDFPKYFWAFPVFNYTDNKIQILEITQKSILKFIRKQIENPKWGDPRNYDFIVNKGKEGEKTVYTVTNDPKEVMDGTILAEYKGIDVRKSKETIKIGDVEFDKEEVEKRLKGLKPIE